eukprot:498943-Amphidinium_carterae.1
MHLKPACAMGPGQVAHPMSSRVAYMVAERSSSDRGTPIATNAFKLYGWTPPMQESSMTEVFECRKDSM